MTKTQQKWRLGVYGIITVWVILAVFLSLSNPTIGNSDTFGYIQRAIGLSLSKPCTWVHAFYPFGYPLLLRLLSAFVTDYELAGRIIALVSAFVVLVLVGRTAREVFDDCVAFLGVVFCATNPSFLRLSINSGTDMPSVAFLMFALSFLVLFCKSRLHRHLILSGMALGVAYLMRYTALTLIPPIAMWLLIVEGNQSIKSRIVSVLVFVSFFILAAFPQLVLAYIVERNPFYNLQARNVYFGIYGDGNWGLNMPAARTITSIGQIVLVEPLTFLRHWYYTAISVFRIEIVQYPLWIISAAGVLISFKTISSRKETLLVLLCMTSFVVATSMAFLSARLLLFCTPILSVYASYGCFRLIPNRLPVMFINGLPIRTLTITLLGVWLVFYHIRPIWKCPMSNYDQTRMLVSEVLLNNGSPQPKEVLAFSFDYYDMSRSTKDRYALNWFETEFREYESLGDIASRMRCDGQMYLVFDDSAPRNVRGLDRIWPFDSDELLQHFESVDCPSETVWIYKRK